MVRHDPDKTAQISRANWNALWSENRWLRAKLERFEWLTIKEAAERLNVSPSLIRGLLLRGDIRAVKVGNSIVRIDSISLEQYTEERDYRQLMLEKYSPSSPSGNR